MQAQIKRAVQIPACVRYSFGYRLSWCNRIVKRMSYHVVLYSPDRGEIYDGNTPNERGVGGGITARIALLAALARLGHRVEAVVNCAARVEVDGVTYIPLDEVMEIDCDILIGCSTGGALSFESMANLRVSARFRLIWVMGSPQPAHIDYLQPEIYLVASNFLRDVVLRRWDVAPKTVFVMHHGLKQTLFELAEANPVERDPYALVYTGHPSKGLDAAISVLRRLRIHDDRFYLDVYGGNALWGSQFSTEIDEPGVTFHGLTGQRELIPRLYKYGFCIALQEMEEGFSIAVQEAKRAGVIVIANDGSSFPEAIANGIDGFLFHERHNDPACHARAADLILSLVNDPERMERIRSAARRTPWDWDIAARTCVQLWDWRLAGTSPPLEIVDGVALARFADGLHNLETGYFYENLETPSIITSSPKSVTTKRLLVAGYYGFNNLGDEAILTALLQALRAQAPSLQFTVVSGDPERTASAYGVEAVEWNNIAALTDAAEAADAIILGGGGLFQDYWGVPTQTMLMPDQHGMAYFMAFPLLAALLDKPFALYALGVGPLQTDEGRAFTRAAFEIAGRASVRDAESRSLMIDLGIEPDRLIQSADPAYLLQPASSVRSSDLFDSLRLTEKSAFQLGVALRAWDVGVDQAQWMAQVAAALDGFIDQVQAQVLFIPFQAGGDALSDDRAACERVRQQMRHGGRVLIADPVDHASDMLSLLGSCDLILGMRLHSILLAAVVGVPSVGLIYDPKVRQAMKALGLDDLAHDLDSLRTDALLRSLMEAHSQRDELSRRVSTHAETLAQMARADAVGLYEWLQSPTRSHRVPDVLNILSRDALIRYLKRSASLVDQNEALQRAVAMLNQRDQRILSMLGALDVAKGENATLKQVISGLEQAALDLNQTIAELHLSAAKLEQDKAELVSHLTIYESEISRLIETNAALTNTLADAENRLRASHAMVEHLRRDMASSPFSASFRFAQTLMRNPFRAAKIAARTAYHLTVPLSLRLAFKTLRQRHVEFGAFLRNPPYFLARKLYQVTVPLQLRLALRERRERRMNWYAYHFDRYKRARNAAYGTSFNGIRVPCELGLISVVLPAYNGEDMIGEAIETLLAQTYSNWELIIVNDGSKDRTGEIAETYARRDPRIRVVHQENRKIPRTLSRAFRMARGEFLTWTSCDNRMKPDFLQKMMASLRRHPCWDMIYANIDIIGDDGAYLRNSGWYAGYQRPPGSEHVHLPEVTDELNVWANNYIGAAFMYRARTTWLIGDYSANRFTTEDYDYWMRVNALGMLRHADFSEPVYDYRFHDKSLTSKDKELGITRSRERLMVFDDFRRDFYLTPIIWQIEGEDRGLGAAAVNAGHQIVTRLSDLCPLPPFWTPTVYVRWVHTGDQLPEPPADLPEMTLKALILTDDNPPLEVCGKWDCCIYFGAAETSLPRLETPYQGWFGAKDARAVFQLLDIRAKEAQLARIEFEAEQPPAPKYRASVVICTHRLNQRLINAITSLASQTVAPESFEVIVVNNNPGNRRLSQIVDEILASHFGNRTERLRLINCPIRGLSAARNVGIAAAQGEIVCFIDDDAVAEPDWLEHILRAYDTHPNAGIVGGYIQLKPPAKRPHVLIPGLEKYWSHFVGGHSDYMPAKYWYEYPWGANWTARRSALLQIGGFRSGYGRKGDDFGGGEELAAASLIQRLGWEVGVEPSARVQHDVEPSRYTLQHIRRTLRSGHLIQYRLQRDLYLPMETSFRATWFMLRRYNFDPTLSRKSWVTWYDMVSRKLAQITLLRAQLRDWRARYQRPAVEEDDCEARL
ncbi:MAG: polysaccharide pyruvyl transferase CsaB [Phototrophicales bacterium]|nr:MAG: polysaccharide pyruvyl transferase CsaB [Phototrophicales bacterium]